MMHTTCRNKTVSVERFTRPDCRRQFCSCQSFQEPQSSIAFNGRVAKEEQLTRSRGIAGGVLCLCPSLCASGKAANSFGPRIKRTHSLGAGQLMSGKFREFVV